MKSNNEVQLHIHLFTRKRTTLTYKLILSSSMDMCPFSVGSKIFSQITILFFMQELLKSCKRKNALK